MSLKIEGKADRTAKVYKFICLVEILSKYICKIENVTIKKTFSGTDHVV